MSDSIPPAPAPSDGPPPVPSDGLEELGFDGPPAVPGRVPAVPRSAPEALQYRYGADESASDPSGLRIANPGWRALAFALDGFGTFALTTAIVFVGLAAGGYAAFYAIAVVPLLSAVLCTVLTATVGTTPGKALVGLRVVHVVTGRPIGAWAILRSLVIISPLLLAGLVGYALSSLTSRAYGTGGPVDVLYSLTDLAPYVPFAGWVALLIVLIVRPRHRGLEDLVARSIVVRR